MICDYQEDNNVIADQNNKGNIWEMRGKIILNERQTLNKWEEKYEQMRGKIILDECQTENKWEKKH